MAPNEDRDAENNAWTWAALEPEPTETERELLDRFCVEYLRDNDTTRAASRCGFQSGFAQEYGKRFYQRAYVQRRLQFLRQQENALTAKEITKNDTNLALSTLRSVAANEYQPGNVRVAAAAKLLDHHHNRSNARSKPGDGAVGEVARGGVMSVPAIANLEEWEAAATKSQQALAEVSRV